MFSFSLMNYSGIIILQLQRKVTSAVLTLHAVQGLISRSAGNYMLSYQGSDLRTKEEGPGEERVQYLLIYYLKTLVSASDVRLLRDGKIPSSLVVMNLPLNRLAVHNKTQ